MKKKLAFLVLIQAVIICKILPAALDHTVRHGWTSTEDELADREMEACLVCMGSKAPQNPSDRPDYRDLITIARQRELLTGCQSSHNAFFHENCLRRVLRQKSACPICRAPSEQQEVLLAGQGTAPGATIYIAFIDAILADNRSVVQTLAQQYSRLVNMVNHEGLSPLQVATQNNRFWIAQFLLANHAEVDTQNNRGRTSLHSAAYQGNIAIAEFLLRWRAQINMQCSEGCTPLHYAAWQGHSAMVNFLLDAGADKTILDNRNRSAFDWSARLDYPTQQRLLLPTLSLCKRLTHCASALLRRFF